MKMTHVFVVILAVSGYLRGTSAAAQTSGQIRGESNGYNPPSVSPYLLLLPQATSTGGTVTAAPGTYQALVRPLLDVRDEKFRQSLAPSQTTSLPMSASGVRNPQTTGLSNTVRPTGHSATFLNTSHYYPSQRP